MRRCVLSLALARCCALVPVASLSLARAPKCSTGRVVRVKLLASEENLLVRAAQRLLKWELRLGDLTAELQRTPSEDEWATYVGYTGADFAKARLESRRAKAAMVSANLGLVRTVVAKYAWSRGFEDMLQEGTYGLARAVERFDINRGVRFSTYATIWIRQAVIAGLADSDDRGGPRLPRGVRQRLGALRRAEDGLRDALGREPSNREVASSLGVREQTVAFLRSSSSFKTPLSIDAPTAAGRALGSGIASLYTSAKGAHDLLDDHAAAPEARVEQELLQVSLQELLRSTLTEKESRVLTFAFGLDSIDGRPRTNEEVGNLCAVSKQNAHKTKHGALAKLRKSLESQAERASTTSPSAPATPAPAPPVLKRRAAGVAGGATLEVRGAERSPSPERAPTHALKLSLLSALRTASPMQAAPAAPALRRPRGRFSTPSNTLVSPPPPPMRRLSYPDVAASEAALAPDVAAR
ncbi:hypothetical protein M885DRAFT_548942 [Pelagophyceae sp. CCMP2097]|nr:hypothetical protein M885DRAFT_548942 [Pelagophyceae sp. CCMP2097]|mmetsp:Transcript_18169/g.64653  ORF Transcript_18169/g.64653 Transcript_18169/m.64653 type:complete len:468 (-) Transcript_18169:211-1614(-)